MKRTTRRRHAFWAAIAAGILMLASGTVGSTTLLRLGYDYLIAYLPFFQPIFAVVLVILLILASLGGITVLLGAWSIHRGRTWLPKILITVGVGSGILGLAFHILMTTLEGGNPFGVLVGMGTTFAGLGILLSIYARQIL